jgi:hypothetical protein
MRASGGVVGERVKEGLDAVGKRFGAHRVEKLTRVWSSMVARSSNGEPPVVVLPAGARWKARGSGRSVGSVQISL